MATKDYNKIAEALYPSLSSQVAEANLADIKIEADDFGISIFSTKDTGAIYLVCEIVNFVNAYNLHLYVATGLSASAKTTEMQACVRIF